MSEEMDTLVENIRQPSVWIRIVFMLGFAIVLNIILLPIIIVLVIVQALFSVFSGESNENLRFFAAALGQYVSQVIKFLTYNSETKPFPFSDFPQLEDYVAASPEADSNDAEGPVSANQEQAPVKKSAAKKTAGKKGVSKKATAKKKSARKASTKKSEPANENDD